jgi:hypothetical protein
MPYLASILITPFLAVPSSPSSCSDSEALPGKAVHLSDAFGIDGPRLAELMIEFDVAVATEATYTVKRIDNDFFESI